MFRRIALSSGLLPALPTAFSGIQQRLMFSAPTQIRLQGAEAESDEFDVFDDDNMWFMEELLSEGGEMDFVIPADDARILQGEKQ